MTADAALQFDDHRVGNVIQTLAAYFDAAELVFGHGTDNAVDEAGWLVFHVAGLPFDADSAALGLILSDSDVAEIAMLAVERAVGRQPLAYLLGEAWFAGLPFYVDQHVLVPRSPLAELIVSGFEPWLSSADISSALDIGTGSGCIGLALAHYFPDIEVIASDVDAAALAVARQNVRRHQLGHRVRLVEANVFAGLASAEFDLIISNPPYVDAATVAALPAEYVCEPQHALLAGVDGLDVVREILAGAPQFLSDRGIVVVEVGDTQTAVDAAFPELPLTWLEMSDGASGIFLATKADLVTSSPLAR
ncbi:MAG: 50S ribosomal protein L3 N(5)-glutamine methyltransferase [Pseudomonadota bacterium]